MEITNAVGDSVGAKVDSENRLHTRSVSISLQHAISSKDKKTFQVSSDKAIATSSQNLLLLKNTSNTKELVISYIRISTGGAAATNAAAFFTINIGGDSFYFLYYLRRCVTTN